MLRRLETMRKAFKRRLMRDVGHVLKTGTPTPIRKQRTRWFREALARYNGDKYPRCTDKPEDQWA